jgi:hypothetical protein
MSTTAVLHPETQADGNGRITSEAQQVPQEWLELERTLRERNLERDQEYAQRLLGPWREASKQARAAGWPPAGGEPLGFPIGRLTFAPPDIAIAPRPSWAPDPLDLYYFLDRPARCYGMWQVVPPFQEGAPTTLAVIDGPSFYDASSSIVSPQEGKMALAAAVGVFWEDRWIGGYYDPQSGFSGQTAYGDFRHTVWLPGPVRALSRVDVSIDIERYKPSSRYRWIEANSWGPAGVKADMSVGVMSTPFGGVPAYDQITFAEEVHDRALGVLANTDLYSFTLRAAHVLRPGTTGIMIHITCGLQAFVSGRVEDIGDGFAAIDLRSDPLAPWRPSQKAVSPILFGGGPISVNRIRMTFCEIV